MNIEEIAKRMHAIQIDQKVGIVLEQVNFHLAECMPWCEYETLSAQIKKAELLFKTYILECVKDEDDKGFRIQTMKIFKEVLEELPNLLVKYRKHVQQTKKEMAEKEKKKSKEKKE